MKILKLRLFQETACYKKPFAFKVAETYPLPPYSTVIGMLHKILEAKSGEYYPMNISIQGNYESIFSNYQNLRMFKGNNEVTAMPRNVHQLLNVNLVIHVKAENEIIDKLYYNIIQGKETFTLGRNEDLVKIDEIKIIKEPKLSEYNLEDVRYNAYIQDDEEDIKGINYRINTTYTIKNELRKWNKINVKYVEKHSNIDLDEALRDEDGDYVFFYSKEMPHLN